MEAKKGFGRSPKHSDLAVGGNRERDIMGNRHYGGEVDSGVCTLSNPGGIAVLACTVFRTEVPRQE